jgi:capsular exopolysaccharide synthesis family protein
MTDLHSSDRPQGGLANWIDLSGIVARYRRHAPLVLAITAAVLALDATYTFLKTPLYTATATVFYAPKKQELGKDTTSSAQDDVARDQAVDTQVEVVKSPSLADEVITSLHLDEDPDYALKDKERKLEPALQRDALIDHVVKDLKVKRIGQTLLLSIGFTNKSPTKASRIANAFAETYIKRQIDVKVNGAGNSNTLLNAQIDEMRQKVETAEAAVEQYKAANNLLSSDQGPLTQQQITQLDSQLAAAKSAEAEAEARLRAAQRQLKGGGSGGDVGAALGSQTITDLRQQRAQISATVADLEGRYGPRHPDLLKAQRQLSDIDAQIQAEINRIISNLSAQVDVTHSQTASVQASIDQAKGQLVSGNAASVKLNELERDADAARTLYESVLTRVKETAAQQAVSQADSRIDSPAAPPSEPSSPNKPLNFLLGLVAGLGLGIAAAFIVERWNAKLTSVDDVEGKLGLPFLGSIPTSSSSIDKPTTKNPIDAVVAHPLSGFAEAFRGLGTTLIHGATDAPVRVIAVTSAVPEEGKTTTSICLMRVLALGGTKTVLVDCDLRRRSTNVLFNDEPELGLIEVLDGRATIDQVLRVDEKSGAYVVPLTKGSHLSKSPFSGTAIDVFLEDLKSRFDCVILDTPPLLPVVDTRLLAQKVDALALLVRWRVTPMRAVRAAIHELEAVNAPITGIALTLVNVQSQSYSGYGYQAYYHKDFKKYYLE